jgi:hypothetical protein
MLRVADQNFLLLAFLASIAAYVDIESTVHAQADPEAAEVNSWIYGERPGRVRMYTVNVPVTAGLAALAYSWKMKYSHGARPWVWRVPLLASAVGHGVAAIANYLNFRDRKLLASHSKASH